MRAYRHTTETLQAIVPDEPPPCDYETAMKCQAVKKEFLNIDIDEAPPSYKDYLEGMAAAEKNQESASGFGAASRVTKE